MNLSRKRKVILALLALVLLAGGLFWANQNKEPVYQGKRLSEWVEQYISGAIAEVASDREAEAAAAIRTMGTNCLPWLLKKFSAKPSDLTLKLDRWVSEIPVLSKFHTHTHERHTVAKICFRILGPMAKETVPFMRGILNDPMETGSLRTDAGLILADIGGKDSIDALAKTKTDQSTRIRSYCVTALYLIGKDASDALKQYLHDKDESIRSLAARGLAKTGEPIEVWLPCLAELASSTEVQLRQNSVFAIRKYGDGSKEAALALRNCLTDADGHVRFLSASGLGRMGESNEVWLPSLTSVLNHTYSDLRAKAVVAFEEFGEASKPAVPRLCELLNDPDERVRVAVTNALFKIDPDAAAKAGVHPPPVIELPVER